MHFNVNFNVFFKLIKVHFWVSELCIYQNVRCNDNKNKLNCLKAESLSLLWCYQQVCRLDCFVCAFLCNRQRKAASVGTAVNESSEQPGILLRSMRLVPLLPTDGGALHQCGSIKVLDRSPAPPSTPVGLRERDGDRYKESDHILCARECRK